MDARFIDSCIVPCSAAPSPKKHTETWSVPLTLAVRLAARQRSAGADDAVGSQHALVHIGDMHRSALAFAYP